MKKTILGGEWLFVVKDFLTLSECEAYILDSENRGFEDAMQAVGPGADIFKEIRNNARLLFDDPALAQTWWVKIAPLIPDRPNGRVAAGLNERFRFYRYDIEEKFQPHYDLPFEHPNGDRSELTLMVYLNEGYGGGETVFYTPAGVERFRVSPTAGMALVFPHGEYHEGAAVSIGRKYVLRTDVMFSKSRRFVLD